jgi:hypothetical protein
MALTSPLDLKTHLITVVSGSQEIFTFLAMLVIAFAMSRFSLSNKVSLSLFALFGIIMAAYLQGIYVLIILIIGITTFYSLSKIGR